MDTNGKFYLGTLEERRQRYTQAKYLVKQWFDVVGLIGLEALVADIQYRKDFDHIFEEIQSREFQQDNVRNMEKAYYINYNFTHHSYSQFYEMPAMDKYEAYIMDDKLYIDFYFEGALTAREVTISKNITTEAFNGSFY